MYAVSNKKNGIILTKLGIDHILDKSLVYLQWEANGLLFILHCIFQWPSIKYKEATVILQSPYVQFTIEFQTFFLVKNRWSLFHFFNA